MTESSQSPVDRPWRLLISGVERASAAEKGRQRASAGFSEGVKEDTIMKRFYGRSRRQCGACPLKQAEIERLRRQIAVLREQLRAKEEILKSFTPAC